MQNNPKDIIPALSQTNDKRIVLLVLDGLGDTNNSGRGTALQIANTPNMDNLAESAALGLAHPVSPGITPGSGPGHMGLFGYDPEIYNIGRGVLSALGIDFPLQKKDVAARMNFCTVDKDGKITDRRAGRISTKQNKKLVDKIRKKIKTGSTEVFIETESEHRALLVLRGNKLTVDVGDTDPQNTGISPLDPARPPYEESETAATVKNLFSQIRDILKDEAPANMLISRGFAKLPDWPSFEERFRMNPAAVAGHPMYRGIARLLGMKIFSEPVTPEDIIKDTVEAMNDYKFIFAHYKDPDKKGEDGNIDEKVAVIEKMDKALPLLIKNKPDVLIITGDHSTPAPISSHSWHPVPILLRAPYTRGPYMKRFDEITALRGELGMIRSKEIMPLAMAHAGKLKKFGA